MMNSTTWIDRFTSGEFVIVMDDTDRENEGDLILSAEHVTPAKIAFMIHHTSGIICVPMTSDRAQRLQLHPMVLHNTDPHHTAFTVSCDAKNTTTGVSATDRCTTITTLCDDNSSPSDFRRPGHVFPLIARSGLHERQGHTEAAIELCRLARKKEIAVIAELTRKDGEMFRRPDCEKFSKKHNIPLITVSDIVNALPSISTNINSNVLLISAECDKVPIIYDKFLGYWNLKYIKSPKYNYIVASYNLLKLTDTRENILCRVHSECFTSEVLGSALCDCASQLHQAMALIYERGPGLIIYIKGHEGRGIGLENKLQTYHLQLNDGMDTFKANEALGFPHDCRDYTEIPYILDLLKIKSIKLLTNNKQKVTTLSKYINETINLKISRNEYNTRYLEAKALHDNYM